ncbi:MAG TPA: hypothetical protein VKA63_04560 [Candidatus Krumholzibacteria bacterium]|nr:hypothetical protein [Candidatus Krumholzibacteria bacterium]
MSRAIALAVTIFLSSFLAACSREPPQELPVAPDESVQSAADSLLGADPGKALPADPELEEFLRRAQFLLRRLSTRRPTREEMQRAVRVGPAGFADLAGISPAELSARMDTLRWQGAILLQRYSALAACLEEVEREEGPPCDPSDAVGLVQELRSQAKRRGQLRLNREDLPYVASLILSAATGNPVLYFVGSALATRTWRSG